MTDAPDGPSPRLKKRVHTRAEFEATVADIEAQVRATNARIEKRTGRNLPLAIVIGLGLGFGLLFSVIVVKDLFVLFAGALQQSLRPSRSHPPRFIGSRRAIGWSPSGGWRSSPSGVSLS
jgi:phosphatidate cytidylyltransferase